MAKGTVDGETQPKKKKMSKKRKALIALGVIAGVLVGAWVLVITPAINNIATEKAQAVLPGAIIEFHADGAKITMPTLPDSIAASGVKAKNLVVELGGLGVDDISGLLASANSGKLVLPEGTHFSMTADALAVNASTEITNLEVKGTEKAASITGTISNELAAQLAEAMKDGKIEGSSAMAGLPLDSIVLTPGVSGTLMEANVDVAAILALLNGQP